MPRLPGKKTSELVRAAESLDRRLSRLLFAAPVTHVYRPSCYARAVYHEYLLRYGSGRKQVILVGMNPGPWGMAQTGVPFGEVASVRDWLGLSGKIVGPRQPHPARPVTGFSCTRREVSGARLWGWAKDCFVHPKNFFARFFVYNWCPLAFMEASGKNRTPNQLPASERQPLERACDEALRLVVLASGAKHAIGVGDYARRRLAVALADTSVVVGQILHPSPASPLANRGWAAQATAQLRALGIDIPA